MPVGVYMWVGGVCGSLSARVDMWMDLGVGSRCLSVCTGMCAHSVCMRMLACKLAGVCMVSEGVEPHSLPLAGLTPWWCRVCRPQKVKAYTTPTTTMFPSVAMMAIHSKTASLEDRGGSSGWPWPLAAAWTLAEELNREYSVLKSSLGESMKAPPIMGSCKEGERELSRAMGAWADVPCKREVVWSNNPT